MNVIGILKKYTKQSILDEIKSLYPTDDYSLWEYERIMDIILEKTVDDKEPKYTIYFEMQFDTDENNYRLYALNNDKNDGQEVNITKLSVEDTVFAKIDEELQIFMEEKKIIAEIIYQISNSVSTLSNPKIIKINLDNLLNDKFDESDKSSSIFSDIFSLFTSFDETINEIMEKEEIGEFDIHSGKLILADPSEYEIENNPNILDVKNGKWISEITHVNNHENFTLILKHEDYKDKNLNSLFYDGIFEESPNTVSIRTSMIAAVDLNSFRNDSLLENDYVPAHDFGLTFKDNKRNEAKKEKWFGKCCDVTIDSKNEAGIIPNGVVASILFSQGNIEYSIFKDDNNEKIIGIRIYLINLEKGINF